MTTVAEPVTVDLPTVDYENAPHPAEAHRRLAVALSQGPVAIGAHGPEILGYELARTALRDQRMCVPEGLGSRRRASRRAPSGIARAPPS